MYVITILYRHSDSTIEISGINELDIRALFTDIVNAKINKLENQVINMNNMPICITPCDILHLSLSFKKIKR